MIADFLKESVSVGGASNLTLGGAVTNYGTINSKIAVDVRFPYVIRDGSAWETGKAYLSAASTFVRETFHDSSTGSALTVTTSAEVWVGASAFEIEERCQGTAGAYHMHPYHSEQAAGSASSVDNGEIWYVAIRVEFPDTYDAIVLDVDTQSGNVRLGLYDVKNGNPHNLLLVHDTSTAVGVAGLQAFTFDEGSTFLPAGHYFVGITTDGGPVFEGLPNDSLGGTPIGLNFTGSQVQNFGAIYGDYTYAAMPNPANLTNPAKTSDSVPVVTLRQG